VKIKDSTALKRKRKLKKHVLTSSKKGLARHGEEINQFAHEVSIGLETGELDGWPDVVMHPERCMKKGTFLSR
jgi:hypothetical protein